MRKGSANGIHWNITVLTVAIISVQHLAIPLYYIGSRATENEIFQHLSLRCDLDMSSMLNNPQTQFIAKFDVAPGIRK